MTTQIQSINPRLPDFARHFAPVIGQERSVRVLVREVDSYAMGGDVPRGRCFGSAGLGKSFILSKLALAVQEAFEFRDGRAAKNNVLHLENAEGIATLKDPDFLTLSTAIQEVRPFFLIQDEIHTLTSGRGKDGTKASVFNFLKDALQEKNDNGGEVRWRTSESPVFVSRKNFGVFAATNFPAMVRDSEAMFRRLTVELNLDVYSVESAAKIICGMFRACNLKIENGALYKRLARCGRGTCEVPAKVTRDCRALCTARGDDTVTADDIWTILRDAKRFPRGLKIHEVKILDRCQNIPQPPAALAFMLAQEKKAIDSACYFLNGQTDDDDKPTPFLRRVKGGVVTTKDGQVYLAACKKLGFTWND